MKRLQQPDIRSIKEIAMSKAMICLLIAVLGSPVAFAQNIAGRPFIAVRGHAEVRVVPDVFPVAVTFSDTQMDGGKAQATVEQLVATVIAKAKARGLEDADLSIGNLLVTADSEYDDESEKSKFTGTKYQRRLEFRFRKLVDLKSFLAELPARKEVQAQTLEFRLAEPGDIRRRLLAAAIEDSRKTGDVFAQGMGGTLGNVQTISDKPLQLSTGSYINPIDVSSVESTTILTAEQIANIPVARNITSAALLAPGSVRGSSTEIAISEGVVRVVADVYVIYLLND
ncbi:SIMPL domain-containing protein [Arenimonas sp.]|uniref:SIMPL domain-containing protein n=1 Tax=Arenimonas sp. TaxID=1872635 RepID=UPI0039E4C49F